MRGCGVACTTARRSLHGSELGRNVADYGLKNHLRPVSSPAGN